MRRRVFENSTKIILVIATVVMTILRFLLNEKGRVNPDSIRFMRSSSVFPSIDNTTTPLGYPLSLKFFTLFGLDEFWASKLVGILAYAFIIWFAWKKKFYLKETVMTGALFSFVSIFSFTLSEPLLLPFVLVFLYVGRQITIGQLTEMKGVLYLSLMLIVMYNIRYPTLFFIGAVLLFGMLNIRKTYGKTFIYSALAGFGFVLLYKFLFIDYFNENYIDTFLEIGLHPTSKLLVELFQGLTTTFNPFVHIANPAGGSLNYGIYAIGVLNIALMVYVFIRNGLSETETFLVFSGICGILCSYFIQYFYGLTPLDYRLLNPFAFPLWLVYFRKLYQVFGRSTYMVPALSLMTGFVFIWMSHGNYLQNRRIISNYLKSERLENSAVNFYIGKEMSSEETQIAEIISTVNPRIYLTTKPEDTLKEATLTPHRVLSKIKIDENEFQ